MKLKSKLLLALLATSSAAFAQTAPSSPEVTYNVGVVSQYRYRGLAQSKGRPALQGGIDYANSSGYYLGAWASQIQWIKDSTLNSANWNANNASYNGDTELDLYGGYKFENSGVAYDVGFLSYQYPGNNLGINGSFGTQNFKYAATNEIYAAATAGAYTFKWSYSLTTLFGNIGSRGSDYFDLTANYDLGNGYTLSPHLGRAVVTGSAGLSYSDGSVTLAKDLGEGLTATVSAIATTAKGNAFNSSYTSYQTGKSAVVVGLKYGF